jgi:hypothetical protein
LSQALRSSFMTSAREQGRIVRRSMVTVARNEPPGSFRVGATASAAARPEDTFGQSAGSRLLRPINAQFTEPPAHPRLPRLVPVGSGNLCVAGVRPAEAGPSMSHRHSVEHRCRRMAFSQLGAPRPSRRQAIPCSFALGGPREFHHRPAFGGKPPEFFRRIHRAVLPLDRMPD